MLLACAVRRVRIPAEMVGYGRPSSRLGLCRRKEGLQVFILRRLCTEVGSGRGLCAFLFSDTPRRKTGVTIVRVQGQDAQQPAVQGGRHVRPPARLPADVRPFRLFLCLAPVSPGPSSPPAWPSLFRSGVTILISAVIDAMVYMTNCYHCVVNEN
jgi:hypothetical protein